MFVIISGLPGSGKSTISTILKKQYEIPGLSTIIDHKIVETHAPGDSFYFLVNDELKYRVAEDYRGDFFILERGVESTYAYIKAFDKVFHTQNFKTLEYWFLTVPKTLPKPLARIHLKIDEKLSIARRYPDGVIEDEGVWTNPAFLSEMERETISYLSRKDIDEKPIFIDATENIQDVVTEVLQIMGIQK